MKPKRKGSKRKSQSYVQTCWNQAPIGLENTRINSAGVCSRELCLQLGLALKPSLLIADEPTKGLTPPPKHQIVALLSALVREEHSSLLLITHDLEVAATICDRIAVMYAGEILGGRPCKKNPLLSRASLYPEPPAFPSKIRVNVAVGQSPSLISPLWAVGFIRDAVHVSRNASKIHPDLLKTGPRTYVRCHGIWEKRKSG